jgi:hypothetical protein
MQKVRSKKGVTMRKLLRLAAATAVSASLTTGLAAAQSGSIDTTGPNSHNTVTVRSSNKFRQTNNNRVSAHVSNDQHAYSGDAKVKNNTNAGDATSGTASNDNSTSISASVSNSSPDLSGVMSGGEASADMSTTGPNSYNKINVTSDNSVRITNNNNVRVSTTNDQHASSGDATVQNNTNGGSATTGDASNTNSTTIDLSVSN